MTKNKPVALVTGASSGLGRDCAFRLIAEGYIVYGAARRFDRMLDLQSAGAKIIKLDVTDDASMVTAVEQIVAREERIDVLVNNAGYGQMGSIEDVPIEAGRRQMEVNLIGAARMIQLCLPHMRARKFGKIINVSSIGGKCAFPMSGWYHASKFALEGFSDSLRMEVRPFGIDVVVIEPAGTDSEWAAIALKESERHSSEGAYSKLENAMRSSPSWKRKLPSASVISDLVVKALKAKTPRTRYRGTGGGPILFLRRRLSDRLFDKLIMAQIK